MTTMCDINMQACVFVMHRHDLSYPLWPPTFRNLVAGQVIKSSRTETSELVLGARVGLGVVGAAIVGA